MYRRMRASGTDAASMLESLAVRFFFLLLSSKLLSLYTTIHLYMYICYITIYAIWSARTISTVQSAAAGPFTAYCARGYIALSVLQYMRERDRIHDAEL